jgi:hypothetical protein
MAENVNATNYPVSDPNWLHLSRIVYDENEVGSTAFLPLVLVDRFQDFLRCS